jgi:hypothetical protein
MEKAIAMATGAAVELLKKGYREHSAQALHQMNSETDAAESASHGANQSGTPEAHKYAADLHQNAADLSAQHGERSAKKYHEQQAAHHRAYTRTSQSGAVSNVSAKGAPTAHTNSRNALHGLYQDRREKAEIASGEADDYASHNAAAMAHRRAAGKALDKETERYHQKMAEHHTAKADKKPTTRPKWQKVDASEHNQYGTWSNRGENHVHTKTWSNR